MVQTRAAVWVSERIEKSRHFEAADPPILERAFLAVETSIETGFLGVQALGIPVYVWLLAISAVGIVVALVHAVRRRLTAKAGAAIVLVVTVVAYAAPPERTTIRFYEDDPLQVDPDTLPFGAPEPRELSEAYNLLVNTLGVAAGYGGPALNVNTVGDVPASSWFVDRHYPDRLSLDELRAGPLGESGPDTASVWNVVLAERDGKSIGLQIVDGNGTRYVLKLDAPAFPEVSTAAEVVTSRFLHALGYHVPHNSIVRFKLDGLQPGREDVTSEDIERILQQAHRYPDSTYRAVASKYIEGHTLGPFKFFGTRTDDPNDIFPHELRRELRGLRIIAAWLNHTDVRAQNTLTSAIPSESGAYVRHYLIDFGTTLGGSPFGKQRPWAGHEYWLKPIERLKRILSFGLHEPPWEDLKVPSIRGVGNFTGEGFDPKTWVPIQPNAAFSMMDGADAFWAAARVGWFTNEEIRAVVETGDYYDSAAVEYITNALIERRNRIVSELIPFAGGLDHFETAGSYLTFRDLLEMLRAVELSDETVRTARWWRGGTLLHEEQFDADSLMIPAALIDRVEIETPGLGTTEVHFKEGVVVGVARCDGNSECDALERQQAGRDELFAKKW